jgi:branched-chain amino acid transport system substrate-binding protein
LSRSRPAACLLAAAALLAGCGSRNDAADGRIAGTTLRIYSSNPLHGASGDAGRAVVQGAELALAQAGGRIGKFRVVLDSLDDSTPQRGTWDPAQTTLNARLAAGDPSTVGYIGELDSGASAISIPLLNRAGIPQISPTSTALGLTAGGPAASPGEPQKYYPTGTRTFARVVPNDSIQGPVLVRVQRRLGCTRTYVLDDDEFDGADTATSFELAAQAGGLQLAGTQSFPQRATDYSSLVAGIAQSGADCVLVSAVEEPGVVLLTRQLAAALPHGTIFAAAELAQSSYADAIPAAIDRRVLVVSPALDGRFYPPAGRAFLDAYRRRFGTPEPAAIFGYEAMSLMLDSIARATDDGRRAPQRARVLRAIFSTRDHRGAPGTYGIDSSGDTTLRRYGVWRIADGRLSFWTAIDG